MRAADVTTRLANMSVTLKLIELTGDVFKKRFINCKRGVFFYTTNESDNELDS